MSISYNRKFFDILKDLSPINNSVVIQKSEDKIIVRRVSQDTNLRYNIVAPVKSFDVDRDILGIYNYVEFYQFLKLFNEPTIEIKDKCIILSENNSKVEYFISNIEACGESPETKWHDADIKFALTSRDLDSIVKASGLIGANEKRKKIRVRGNGKTVDIGLVNMNINPQNDMYDKTYNKSFDVEQLVVKELLPFDFLINADFFTNIPKHDYTIEIKTSGYVRAYFVDDEIEVDIFTVFIKERN